MHRYRFAYISSEDPADKKVWSGTLHRIFEELRKKGEVVALGPYKPRIRLLLLRFANQALIRLSGKRLSYRHTRWMSSAYAQHFGKLLRKGKFDFIVAPAASGEIALLDTDIPVIYITDGTFAGCLNYHKALSGLTERSVTEGNFIEGSAIRKSRYVIVSSQWAADSVVNDYGASREKVKIIPYGANFDLVPQTGAATVPVKTWKILFVGVYWESKGGEIAFKAFRKLADKGFDVTLTVVGCTPPAAFQHENMETIPFLDKNNAEDQNRLAEIYATHHFLLLPTRFDCTPIVINEASAFAVPSLVADSGGIRGHLENGVNGFLVDYNDKGDGYAGIIQRYISDQEAYRALRDSTRRLYETRLNWDHWTDEFMKIISS